MRARVVSATVIMCVDHFLLPRMFRISRPLTNVPSWQEAGAINLPAVIALLAAVFFGVTGTRQVPAPIVGAGLPGLIAACFGLDGALIDIAEA